VTLTEQFYLDGVKINHCAKYTGHLSFRSAGIIRRHRHTHTAGRLRHPDHKVVAGSE